MLYANSPTAQDVPWRISAVLGVTGKWRLLSHAKKAARCLGLSIACVQVVAKSTPDSHTAIYSAHKDTCGYTQHGVSYVQRGRPGNEANPN